MKTSARLTAPLRKWPRVCWPSSPDPRAGAAAKRCCGTRSCRSWRQLWKGLALTAVLIGEFVGDPPACFQSA